jgi:hypothetical protein
MIPCDRHLPTLPPTSSRQLSLHPAAQIVVDVPGGLGAEMMINTTQQDTQQLLALTVIDSHC